MKTIKIKYFSEEIEKLVYIDGKSDWIDLRAAETIELKAGDFKLIPLGVAMELPEGYEAHVIPRSSTFKNFGIIQTNSMGLIDENGVFTAVGNSGVKGNIYVEYKNVKKTIPVQVGPNSINFLDTLEHWAREFIGNLAARGIVNGMGDNLYQPDGFLTRAQFLTMLSKSVSSVDVTSSAPAGFSDVPQGEWYYHYVNWGFENGIVAGTSETTFDPDAKITREQMAMMLNNFSKYSQATFAPTVSEITFTDTDSISEWAAESVKYIVRAGIMSGHPEGNFDPQGHATRAQAATVVYKSCQIMDSIGKIQ